MLAASLTRYIPKRQLASDGCRFASTINKFTSIDTTVIQSSANDNVNDVSCILASSTSNSFSSWDLAASAWTNATDGTQWLIEGVHGITGLPWWSTIVVATLGLRLSLFPFTYYNAATQHRLATTIPDIKRLNEARAEALYSGTQTSSLLQRQMHSAHVTLRFFKGCRAVWKKHGAHPMRRFVPISVQLPCFILFALTWRKMIGAAVLPSAVTEGIRAASSAGISLEDFDIAAATGTSKELLLGLQTEGTLWFPDLTVADQTLVLPISIMSISYLSLHLSKSPKAITDGKFFPKLLDSFQVAMIAGLPLISQLPAGVFCYMGTSALWGLALGVGLRSEQFRRLIYLPTTNDSVGNPNPSKPNVVNLVSNGKNDKNMHLSDINDKSGNETSSTNSSLIDKTKK